MADRLLKPKPKRGSDWMKSFVLPKPSSDADAVRYENMQRIREYQHKIIKQK